MDNRPIISLERNNAGSLFIGVTELDSEGCGVRSYVLASQTPKYWVPDEQEWPAASVMERRFDDLVRLMGDNVRVGKKASV
jgi:hypothetical protein